MTLDISKCSVKIPDIKDEFIKCTKIPANSCLMCFMTLMGITSCPQEGLFFNESIIRTTSLQQMGLQINLLLAGILSGTVSLAGISEDEALS